MKEGGGLLLLLFYWSAWQLLKDSLSYISPLRAFAWTISPSSDCGLGLQIPVGCINLLLSWDGPHAHQLTGSQYKTLEGLPIVISYGSSTNGVRCKSALHSTCFAPMEYNSQDFDCIALFRKGHHVSLCFTVSPGQSPGQFSWIFFTHSWKKAAQPQLCSAAVGWQQLMPPIRRTVDLDSTQTRLTASLGSSVHGPSCPRWPTKVLDKDEDTDV